MKTYTWNELVDKSTPKILFVKNSDMLGHIRRGRYSLFMKDRETDVYHKGSIIPVTDTDPFCRFQPIKVSVSNWLETSEYGEKWVIVDNVFLGEPAQPPAQTKEEFHNSLETLYLKLRNNPELLNVTEKENEMTIQNTRRTVRVELIDNDKGLDVQYSLVASFDNVMTEDDDATVIQEIIMEKGIGKKLKDHNNKRESQIDLDILQRTGNSVNLRPVKLKDLTWVVK